MGLYFRKSKSFGPFRINLSKSGVGISTGIKGLRVSTGPKGTYLNAGRNGIYYRKKIGGRNRSVVSHRQSMQVGNQLSSCEATSARKRRSCNTQLCLIVATILLALVFNFAGTVLPATIVFCCTAGLFLIQILTVTKSKLKSVDNYFDGLTKAISKANILRKLWVNVPLFLFYISILSLFYSMGDLMVICLLLMLLSAFAFGIACSLNKAAIEYELDGNAEKLWREVIDALMLLTDSNIKEIAFNRESDTEPAENIRKVQIIPKTKNLAHIVSGNCTSVIIKTSKYTYLFLPDRIVIIGGLVTRAISYNSIEVIKRSVIVKNGDSEAAYYTAHWEHENSDGSKDLRFKSNRCTIFRKYDVIELQSSQDLWIEFIASKSAILPVIAERLTRYFNTISNGDGYINAEDSTKALSADSDNPESISRTENTSANILVKNASEENATKDSSTVDADMHLEAKSLFEELQLFYTEE